MARGRIIVSDITRDKRINDLSDDTSRLAFTWLITFADREGRTHGDPAVVRSMVFPRREDVSVDRMRGYISEWAACGLIVWYEGEGDQWISFPSFAKHQTGFDQRHESQSTIPEPPDQAMSDSETEYVRTTHVQCTAEMKGKEHEGKGIEEGCARKKTRASAPPLPAQIAAFREAAGGRLLPRKATWELINNTVGYDVSELERWKSAVVAWVARGFNPQNVAGMLQWYQDGIPPAGPKQPGGNRNGNDRRRVEPGTAPGPDFEQTNRIRALHDLPPLTQEQFAKIQ